MYLQPHVHRHVMVPNHVANKTFYFRNIFVFIISEK